MDFTEIAAAHRLRFSERNVHEEVIRGFLLQLKQLHQGYSGKIPWRSIGELGPDDAHDFSALPESVPDSEAFFRELVIVKLNGGLGFSMGLDRAKSLLPVKEGLTFLNIIIEQVKSLRVQTGREIPLLFMNSFKTREDTLIQDGVAALNGSAPGDIPPDFLQNMIPRVYADSLLPYGDGTDPDHWCPPGHGDVYISLLITDTLERLLAAGYRRLFISNCDNLGAQVNERILEYIYAENLDFCIEITPKTLADRKGGTFFRRLDENGKQGNIELLERAQVADEHVGEFEDIKRFKYFNINNLYVNIEALRDRLAHHDFDLSLIVNDKTLANGDKILQLETAMGSAIGNFPNARAVVVDRDRFAPVKTSNDLIVRRSDAYSLDRTDFSLRRNPDLVQEPLIHLDDRWYKNIGDFDSLVPSPPGLLECESLAVEGPVLFDKKIEIQGKVVIRARGDSPRPISSLGKKTLKDETLEL